MIVVALLALVFPVLALDVAVEVGWAGRAVVGAVNPVGVTLQNPQPQAFSGELRLSARIGSPWRGEAQYTARVPLFLAPFGRARMVIPWPVMPGTTTLNLELVRENHVVFAREVPLALAADRLQGAIGPPWEPAEVQLTPLELPHDPLLLGPFSELKVHAVLSEHGFAVVRAWAAFLGGASDLVPSCAVSFTPEPLLGQLRDRRPAPPLWAALVPGLFLYLLGLGLVLPRFSRGSSQLFLVYLVVSLTFSLIYGLYSETKQSIDIVWVRISCQDLGKFFLELCGGVSWRGERWVLPGFWVEVLPERGWEGLDLHWVHGPEGWRTEAELSPGLPRLFLRVAEGTPASAERVPPPPWLARALRLPWERAHAERGLLSQGAHKAELWQILMP